jgi:hypothetical protein
MPIRKFKFVSCFVPWNQQTAICMYVCMYVSGGGNTHPALALRPPRSVMAICMFLPPSRLLLHFIRYPFVELMLMFVSVSPCYADDAKLLAEVFLPFVSVVRQGLCTIVLCVVCRVCLISACVYL